MKRHIMHVQYKHVLFTSTSKRSLSWTGFSTPALTWQYYWRQFFQAHRASIYITMKIQHGHVPYQQLYSKFMQQCFMAHECTWLSIDSSHPLNFMPKAVKTARATFWWRCWKLSVSMFYICCDVAILFVAMWDNGEAVKIAPYQPTPCHISGRQRKKWPPASARGIKSFMIVCNR